jgi:uncharacterized protein
MIEITTTADGVHLGVKVVPGSSRTRVLGEWDRRAKIGVAAPPERGRANDALEAFLAKLCGVRKAAVQVVAGHSSPLKTVRIDGVSAEQLLAALACQE